MVKELWICFVDDNEIEHFLLLKDYACTSTLQLLTHYSIQRNTIRHAVLLEREQSDEIYKLISFNKRQQALVRLNWYAGPLVEI